MQELLNFDVAIEPLADGYRTRVVASPAGETHADFAFPFSDTDVENFVLNVLISIGRLRRKVRRIQSPERKMIEDFGGELFGVAFPGPVRECLNRSRLAAESEGAGLRIRLRLPPALANIPWEYLYDAEYGFVSLSPETALVRYVEMPAPVAPLPISPPLRVLAMISAPADVAELQGEEEWDKLNGALEDLVGRGMVQVDRLEAGTLAALQRPLRLHEYHVLHFVGHGGYDKEAQDGALALEGADGRTRLVTGRDLGLMLRGHRSLRLVVLNACEGARSARDDPLGGVAQALVRQGIPAVIAMQFEISDPAALTFSQSFYQAIADGLPVDTAMVEARRAMFAEGNEVEWATPVLYLRAPDGHVFVKGQVSGADSRAREDGHHQAQDEADHQAQEEAERRARDLATRYTLACAAADARDWDQALVAFTMIADVNPGYRDVRERLEDARRQQKVASLQAEVRRMHQSGQWAAVAAVGQQLQMLDPDAADPEGLVTSACTELADKERTERLDIDYQEALRLLDAGNWRQAIDRLERVAQVNPAYRATPALLQQARRQIAGSKPPPKPPPTAPRSSVPTDRRADDASSHADKGDSLYRQHRHADAEAAYRTALTLDPHLATAHAGLGRVLCRQRRYAEAEAACREAIRLNPALAVAYSSLGDALTRLKHYPEAEAACREAIRLDPTLAEAQYILGGVLGGGFKQWSEAEAACREAIRLDPTLAEAQVSLGGVLTGSNRLAEAEAACREAIRLDPTLADAQALLGLVLVGSQRWSEAEAACREAIRLDPALAEAQYILGIALAGFKRWAEAEAACREAIRLDPALAEPHYILGLVLAESKRWTEAEAAYREAIRLDPALAGAHDSLGVVLFESKRLAEAEAAYREAIRLDPTLADAHNHLGVMMFGLKRYPEAEAAYREAIRLDPSLANVHNNLGIVLVESKRLPEAEAAFREAIRRDPTLADAHNRLGVVLSQLKRYPEAEAAYREAIRLDPSLAIAHVNLGQALVKLGRHREAEAAAREAARLNPQFRTNAIVAKVNRWITPEGRT